MNWILLDEDLWEANHDTDDEQEPAVVTGTKKDVLAWAKNRAAERYLIFSSELDDWVDLE